MLTFRRQIERNDSGAVQEASNLTKPIITKPHCKQNGLKYDAAVLTQVVT